ncbi:MAG: arginine--tRNA ligase [Candidatus Coatesbacteria bacterium]|nr:arginine--tRNA ligase [Candidatus Coatesbacteria bacterium]
MNKDFLKSEFDAAVSAAAAEFGWELPDALEITFGVPKSEDLGDYSCNIAMVLAKQLKTNPRKAAEAIVTKLSGKAEFIDRLEVAGPGFINIFLKDAWWQSTIREAIENGAEFGKSPSKNPKKIQIEFVSANPVGPLNVVSARAAALGDSMANLLRAVGNEVEREYYVNDAGNQVITFAQSVASRYMTLIGRDYPFPENGYLGDYIEEVAQHIYDEHGDEFAALADDDGVFTRFRDASLGIMIESQQRTLHDYGVDFEVWFSDRAIREKGALDEVMVLLDGSNKAFEAEGAKWFRATDFGDNRDRVLIKNDGEATYLLGDLAYHRDKYQRGFDTLIDILGPDHQGQVQGLLGGIEAMGFDPNKMKMIISGHVRLLREGNALAMSKRAGDFISMDELLEDVGKDAARYFFLLRSASSHLDFDMDLAKKETPENPVYYVQYAHARVRSIFKKAEEKGVDYDSDLCAADLSLLGQDEARIAKRLCRFEEMIERSAERLEPHNICYYLMDLASEFHSYYNKTKVLTEDPPLTSARLALSEAVRQVIANGLALIGVSPPDAM